MISHATAHQGLIIHNCRVLVEVFLHDEWLLAWHIGEETVFEEVVAAFEGLRGWTDLEIVQGIVQVLVVHGASTVVHEGEEPFGGVRGVSEIIRSVLG